MRKLFEIFKLLWIQNRIVAAAAIWRNVVFKKDKSIFDAFYHLQEAGGLNDFIYLDVWLKIVVETHCKYIWGNFYSF